MDPEKLFLALQALMQVGSETEARQVLAEHPELLDEEVDLLLEQLASQAKQDNDANAAELFAQLRELMRIARSAVVMNSFPEDSELSVLLKEISQPARLQDTPRRIQLCQRALKLVSPENAQLWAMIQGEIGNCLAQSTMGDRAENIEQAIEHYHQALKIGAQKDFLTLTPRIWGIEPMPHK